MRFWVLVLASFFLMTGCSVQSGMEELLSPPRLTDEQAAIYDALENALGTSSFKFKYPRRGQYLSACILRDLDNDGKKEALAFYELNTGGVSSTWMSVLIEQEGIWKSTKQIPTTGSDIDLVAFSRITGQNFDNVVVGCSTPGWDEKICVIYSFDGKRLERMHSEEFEYSEMLFVDTDRNGVNEVLLCTKGGEIPPYMRLLRYRSGRLDVVSEIKLKSGINEYIKLQYGPIADGASAVFADMLMEDGSAATQIFFAEDMRLEEITEGELGFADVLVRPYPSLNCADVNGDGFINIPTVTPMPGYDKAYREDPIYMTEYFGIWEGSRVSVLRTVVNHQGGYRVNLPDSWKDTVTVKPRIETKEWRFVLYTGKIAESETELLRIKVVSPSDYEDRMETADYQLFATKGVNRYMVYIPQNDFPGYSLSYEQLGDIIVLL